MAHSVDEGKGFFEDWLAHFARPLNFSRFLDIGCGAGVYGKIIRLVFAERVQIDAIEIFPEYVRRYNLGRIYDEVVIGDIRNREIIEGIAEYDLIIMGDVLEHLEAYDAVRIAKEMSRKAKFLWCALPLKMDRPWSRGWMQNEEEYRENPAGKHLHDWTGPEIFASFDILWLVPYIHTGIFLIEGKETGYEKERLDRTR
jgi:SAM-dependent methyltransferase